MTTNNFPRGFRLQPASISVKLALSIFLFRLTKAGASLSSCSILHNTLTNVLERQSSRSALYTLAVLFVTTLVTGFFVWRFTRPIKELSTAARKVAGGNFDVQVPADRLDEMGTLASAFNEMTAKLGRARELESQLHQAEKGAVVGRLAAAIAHEIRNPLNYINLTLDHLRSSFAPSDPNKRATFVRLTDQLKTEVARINRHITTS